MGAVTPGGIKKTVTALVHVRRMPLLSSPWRRPVLIGISAVLGLLWFYVGIVTLAEGWNHARELLWEDRFFLGPISLGFGTQIGLYFRLRWLSRLGVGGQANALAASGTGTSGLSMVACCLHHASDVLPLVGLSGAAIFLAQYRVPFMLLAVAMNLAGIVYMLRRIRQFR
jgi:hypothetical protein